MTNYRFAFEKGCMESEELETKTSYDMTTKEYQIMYFHYYIPGRDWKDGT